MHTFEGQTANEAWLKAARAVLVEGESQPSRGGRTLELLHAVFHILDSRARWVISRAPAMNPAFALAEVLWLLNGHEDAAFLNFWNRKLPQYAGMARTYHGAYGTRLRDWRGIDQLDKAARTLTANPDSRQVVLQIWDPTRDLPTERGEPADADIPCNVAATLKVRDGKLEWVQVVRSNDLFLGLPHNFVQFTVLQEVLAGWIGVQPGSYMHISDSLHIYRDDVASVATSLDAEVPASTLRLSFPRSVSEPALRELDSRARAMIRADLSIHELKELVSSFEAPEEFRNWLRILGAEAARRRGWQEVSERIAHYTTNAVLTLLWKRWNSRMTAVAQRGERSISQTVSSSQGG